jgi:hypothetical protein
MPAVKELVAEVVKVLERHRRADLEESKTRDVGSNKVVDKVMKRVSTPVVGSMLMMMI